MTESGERERALKLYEELDGIAREFDNYDFGLSYSDEPRDKSLAIITQFEQAAFEAGRGQEAELLDHALFCMDRGCKRCSEAIEQRRPAPPDSGDAKEEKCTG